MSSVRPKSNTCTTFACDSCIASRTSSKKRATNCGSLLERGADALQRDALRHAGLGHRAGGDNLRHPALGDQPADVVAPDQLRHWSDYIATVRRRITGRRRTLAVRARAASSRSGGPARSRARRTRPRRCRCGSARPSRSRRRWRSTSGRRRGLRVRRWRRSRCLARTASRSSSTAADHAAIRARPAADDGRGSLAAEVALLRGAAALRHGVAAHRARICGRDRPLRARRRRSRRLSRHRLPSAPPRPREPAPLLPGASPRRLYRGRSQDLEAGRHLVAGSARPRSAWRRIRGGTALATMPARCRRSAGPRCALTGMLALLVARLVRRVREGRRRRTRTAATAR